MEKETTALPKARNTTSPLVLARAANPERGEVDIEVAGRVWRMRLCSNTMILLEQETGERSTEVQTRFAAGKQTLKDVRAMIWALVQEYQPGTPLARCGDLLDELDKIDPEEIDRTLGKVFTQSDPEPSAVDPRKARKAAKPKARKKRRGGTGGGSTTSRAKGGSRRTRSS